VELTKALAEAGYKGVYIIEVGDSLDAYTATHIGKDDPLYVPCQLALEGARANLAWAEETNLDYESSGEIS